MDTPQALSDRTQKVVQGFNNLDTDAKLAWFYLVYKKMGDSITPAAPAAANGLVCLGASNGKHSSWYASRLQRNRSN